MLITLLLLLGAASAPMPHDSIRVRVVPAAARPTYDEESVRAALVGVGGRDDMENWMAAYAEGGHPLMPALCAETPLA